MELEYKGANCVVLKTKQAMFVTDPKLSLVGLKDQSSKAKVMLATQSRFLSPSDNAVTLNGPGEYEINNISVIGVPAQVYNDLPQEGKKATMYRIDTGEAALAIIGHVASPLSEEQLEALGVIDIVIVPVGGSGYTLDGHAAVQVVRQIGPKIVIPTHYADPQIKYEVPQTGLDSFIKELGVVSEEMPKLKLKGGVSNDTLSVVVLQRTA